MTDTINEQISTLIDGELPEEEYEFLQHQLTKDSKLQETWRNYHLIRDTMREDLPEFIDVNTGVTYIRHQQIDEQASVSKPEVLWRFARPAAGMAIAASVAMLAIIGVVYNDEQSTTPLTSRFIAAFQTDEQQRIRENFAVIPRNNWQSAKPAVVSHLNGYLVDHSHYARFGSARGIISYSRVAGYDRPAPE